MHRIRHSLFCFFLFFHVTDFNRYNGHCSVSAVGDPKIFKSKHKFLVVWTCITLEAPGLDTELAEKKPLRVVNGIPLYFVLNLK